jgi:hypothetical protein
MTVLTIRPGDPLQSRRECVAADELADVAVDQSGEWVPESKTATVPGESVTATATPVSVTWHPGDGSTVTCQGAGNPYTSADNPAAASPDCGHTYTSSSAGQPGGAFQATATITWDVTWQGAGGAGGVLSPLFTTAVAAFRVAESQALNTSGAT